MSLIEATIQVYRGFGQLYIDVEYGAGRGRVPSDCLTLCQIVRSHFEQGAVDSVRRTLLQRMPDVEVRVVRVMGLTEDPDMAEFEPPKLVRN